MTYLFFDIECANNFGGIGKMCSFGYVLCAADFSVIETADILMNPDAPFDWYLFKPGSKCRLAYSREEYKKQPKFPEFHAKIASLLSAASRLVIGFGCKSDVATIASECARYKLPVPEFACHDIHAPLEQHYETQGGLGAFTEKLGIDTHDLPFHDSRADAYFTMKVTERLCADSKKPPEALFGAFPPLTAEHALKDLQRKLYRKWLERQEEQKAAQAAREGAEYKMRRIRKHVSVPAWFDWQEALERQLAAHSQQR